MYRSTFLRQTKHTIKSPVVMSSTLVSRVLRINLNTRPMSFLETLDTAQISAMDNIYHTETIERMGKIPRTNTKNTI